MMGKENRSHVILDASDPRWLDFAAVQADANIFHHPSWCKLITDCYGYRPFIVAVTDKSDQIRAGIPIMEVKSWLTGRRWVALPFTDHCIPLHRDEESLDALTGALADLYATERIPKIELRWQFPNRPPMQTDSKYVLHTISLSPDIKAVEQRLKRSHRQNIEAAEKRGVRIERGTEPKHLRLFYDLQLQTRFRQGVPVQPRKFFDLLGSVIVKQGLGFVLLAYHEDDCLAGGLFLHWGGMLTYKYNASAEDGLKLRPNNLICWSAIRWGCENGFRLFDFGRADLANEGLRRFKNGWGAEETPLNYSVFSTKQLDRPVGNRFESAIETVIKRSPPWVCKAIGELFYRHSP